MLHLFFSSKQTEKKQIYNFPSTVHRPIDFPSNSHGPLMDLSSNSHRTLIELTSTSHRTLMDLSSNSHGPLIELSSNSHRPLIELSWTSHRTLIELTSTSHRTLMDLSSTFMDLSSNPKKQINFNKAKGINVMRHSKKCSDTFYNLRWKHGPQI